MGVQLSTRAVTFLGTKFVWAQAGEKIKRIANASFFIGFSFGPGQFVAPSACQDHQTSLGLN
jgi:hypothetical protein